MLDLETSGGAAQGLRPDLASPLKPKDYATDQDVRWCPGCGDYAILKGVHSALAKSHADPDRTVFVSGIGCAARFPYYTKTYGFHTIHGRAPAFATGLKLARPDLDVWVVSGDGDALSIGGNHLLHLLRRNVDLQFLLFNNEIYGLTKGQYSPTSRTGTRSPSSPGGSVESPVHVCSFALVAGATFVARSADIVQKHLVGVLEEARAHVGTSFVEILQNCIVYNDGVFDDVTAKVTAADAQVHATHGQPLLYGKDGSKGLVLDTATLSIRAVDLAAGDATEADVLVHDETNPVLAAMLAKLHAPDFPTVLGVIYRAPAPSFEVQRPRANTGDDLSARGAKLNALMREGHTWSVDG